MALPPRRRTGRRDGGEEGGPGAGASGSGAPGLEEGWRRGPALEGGEPPTCSLSQSGAAPRGNGSAVRFPANQGVGTGLAKGCLWLPARHGQGLIQARTRKLPEGLTPLPAHLAGHQPLKVKDKGPAPPPPLWPGGEPAAPPAGLAGRRRAGAGAGAWAGALFPWQRPLPVSWPWVCLKSMVHGPCGEEIRGGPLLMKTGEGKIFTTAFSLMNPAGGSLPGDKSLHPCPPSRGATGVS